MFFFLFFLPCVFITDLALADPVVIAHPSVGVDSLTRKEVKDIFMGKKIQWPDGGQVYLAILQEEPVFTDFTKQYIRKTPTQFQFWWRKRVFTGKGASPNYLNSQTAVLRYVSQTKGAIGYVDQTPEIDMVKTISILDK